MKINMENKMLSAHDLTKIFIPETNVSLVDAEDHTFKNWLRTTLIKQGLTPNYIETDFEVSLVDRVLVVNELQSLGVRFKLTIGS